MEAELIKLLNDKKLIYCKIEDDASLNKIYNLYLHNIFVEPITPVECNYYGLYYQYINSDSDLMKKYHIMAIEKGNSWAMHNLALYYKDIEQDYEQMKKYFLMAIGKGLVDSMRRLAYYYQTVKQNYDEMKKYYLMAIEHGDDKAMFSLGVYYEIKQDYDQMKKYYLMAIEHKNYDSVDNLARYYQIIEQDYDQMEKYYLMAIERGDNDSVMKLGLHYRSRSEYSKELQIYLLNPKDHITRIIETLTGHPDLLLNILNEHKQFFDTILALKLKVKHLQYQPGGVKYEQCKERFMAMTNHSS